MYVLPYRYIWSHIPSIHMDKDKILILTLFIGVIAILTIACAVSMMSENTHEQTFEEKVLDLYASLTYREVEYVYTTYDDKALRAWDAFAVQYYEDSDELIWRYGTEGKGYMIYTHDITKVVYLDGHTDYWK